MQIHADRVAILGEKFSWTRMDCQYVKQSSASLAVCWASITGLAAVAQAHLTGQDRPAAWLLRHQLRRWGPDCQLRIARRPVTFTRERKHQQAVSADVKGARGRLP